MLRVERVVIRPGLAPPKDNPSSNPPLSLSHIHSFSLPINYFGKALINLSKWIWRINPTISVSFTALFHYLPLLPNCALSKSQFIIFLFYFIIIKTKSISYRVWSSEAFVIYSNDNSNTNSFYFSFSFFFLCIMYFLLVRLSKKSLKERKKKYSFHFISFGSFNL